MTETEGTAASRQAERRKDRAARSRARWVRWIVLGAVLVVMTAITLVHQKAHGGGRWSGVDFLCPFGGLETLYSLVGGSGFLRHTAASAVILLVGMLAMAVAFRRSFCGMLCPLGTLQGIFGAAGRKLLGGRRPTVPVVVDRVARYLKYAVLVFFLVWTWQAADLVMRPYDPWVAWAHLTAADLLTTYIAGLVILAVSLAGSLVYQRFFCKYLCPAGALLGLLSRVSFLNIRRDAAACIDCGRCDEACIMNVHVATADVVTSSECISCNECVNACPVPGALKVTAAGGSRVPALAAAGVVLALMAGIVGATTLSGSFAWKSPGLAEAAAESRATSGDGSFDLMLIKGYTTLEEVAEATGIPAEEIGSAFGVPASELGLPIKDVKDKYGFTPEDVRVFVEMRRQQ